MAFHVIHHFETPLKNVLFLNLGLLQACSIPSGTSFQHIHSIAEYTPFALLVGCYLLWRNPQILFHCIDARESIKRAIICFLTRLKTITRPFCSSLLSLPLNYMSCTYMHHFFIFGEYYGNLTGKKDCTLQIKILY